MSTTVPAYEFFSELGTGSFENEWNDNGDSETILWWITYLLIWLDLFCCRRNLLL